MRRLILAALLFLAMGGHASAEPITIALFGSAFAATLGGTVVSFLFTAAAYVGASMLLDAVKPKPKPTTETSTPVGIQFDIQMGEESPIGFTVGTTATAGTRKYIGTWGQDGSTPNAYLTDVIQIGDLPAPGTPGLWVNGQKCTLTTTAPSVAAGSDPMLLFGEAAMAAAAAGITIFGPGFMAFVADYIESHSGDVASGTNGETAWGLPVLEFRKNGRDYLWVKYHDGTQTTADSLLMDKFGGDPDRPWKATMIGRGCPYLVITALFNRELFSGSLTYLVEPPPTPWYDIRKDSTAGGDGAHRWDDPSTWEPTSNNAVIAYNIIRGIYYGDEWLYGGQNLAAFRLPAANVMAAANECDAPRELDGGGTEPQFRCGMEIRGDMEPLTVIAEILKAGSGRIAEVGGIFKMLFGAPGSAVYAFTDDDILVTRGQSLTPWPTLDDTHNGIEATYPEPAEMWATKDAPARYSSVLEAADDGRRLATGVHFAAAPFPVQVQQVMRTMIEEDRRFRRHSFHLPPDAYPLEPLDVVSWTSRRNGYINKKWFISKIVGERTTNQLVLLKEVSPGEDYSWSPADELPRSVGPIAIVRPPAQPMVGWQALPAAIVDSDGVHRRPSIQVRFDSNQDDVRAVRVQVRLASDPATLVFDGELPYGAPIEGLMYATLNAIFMPATAYEVRGIFIPYSGRETAWSAWLAVTTLDIRTNPDDLTDALNALLQRIDERIPDDIFEIRAELRELASSVNSQFSTMREGMGRINIGVGSQFNKSQAAAELAMTVATEDRSALAAMFGDVYAITPAGEAEAKFKIIAGSAPDGVASSISFAAYSETLEAFSSSGLSIDAGVTALGGKSRIRMDADVIMLENSSTGQSSNALMMTMADVPPLVPIIAGTLTVDLTNRQISHRAIVDQPVQIKFPAGGRPGMSWELWLEQDATGGHAVTFDPIFLTPHPIVSQIAGTSSVLEGKIGELSVGVRAAIRVGTGGSTNPLQLIFLNMIEELGLHGDLLACWDAGASDSWDSAVSATMWRDLSGNGLHAERGATTAAPTFNGTIGALTAAEFFNNDGGDNFDLIASSAWNAFHQAGARFGMAFIIFVPSAGAGVNFPLFDTSLNPAGPSFNRGIWLNIQRDGSNNLLFTLNIIDNASGLMFSKSGVAHANLTDKFIFVAVSVNLPVGTNGLIFRINDQTEFYDISLLAPNTGVAWRARPRIFGGSPFAPVDCRIAVGAIWGRAPSITEYDRLYTRVAQSGRWPSITL